MLLFVVIAKVEKPRFLSSVEMNFISSPLTVRPRMLVVHMPTGIGEHDKIGLISNNRWEWAALAAASYSLNAAIVPMVSFDCTYSHGIS